MRGTTLIELLTALAVAGVLLTWGGVEATRLLAAFRADAAVTQMLAAWTPTMTLSDDFYRAVQEHRVPVNMEHLVKLSRSPRRMDLYSWLSYRTPRIRPRGRVPVKLHALWSIFGPDIAEFRDFKKRLIRDLRAIAAIYPGFNAEIDGDILWLRRSPPPVPYRAQHTLPLS